MDHPHDQPLIIDCDDCSAQYTEACDDCVVTFLLRRADDAVVLHLDEARALRLLGAGGVVPELRHEARDRDENVS